MLPALPAVIPVVMMLTQQATTAAFVPEADLLGHNAPVAAGEGEEEVEVETKAAPERARRTEVMDDRLTAWGMPL